MMEVELIPLSHVICSQEGAYLRSKGKALQWRRDDIDDSIFDNYTQTELKEFLKVSASDLYNFCSHHDPSGLYQHMLSDSLMFFKLHNTWQAYICPIPECLCLFLEDDSLVLHLINEHCISLPFLQQNPTEERRCADALRTTVWKPIDATAAAELFEFLCCHKDASLFDADHLANLEWPLSHDLTRSRLLANLQMEFEELLGSLEGRKSFPLLSNGCMRALFAVASEDVLARPDLTNIARPSFRALLYCSPLSFRFMEAPSLRCFLKHVEVIRKLIEDQASRNGGLEGSRDSDAVSFAAGSEYFFLDGAKLNPCRTDAKLMRFWLCEAPYYPTINKLPGEASDILQLVRRNAASFSECLTTVCGQSGLKLAALTSCLKMWNMGRWLTSLHDKSSHELASNSETDTASVDDVPSPYYFVRKLAKQSKTTDDHYQMWRYLQLIVCSCELQFSEFQLRRLCAVDLRTYILPLLRSCLRMILYLSATDDSVEVEDSDEGDVTDGSEEEHSEEHSCCRFEEKTASEDGSDMMTPDKELYSALPDPGSSGNRGRSSGSSGSCITEVCPMAIDGGEALGRDPPGAHTEDTYGRVPQVGCADAAPPWSRTGTGAATAESEAKHEAIMESDAEPESKTEPESQFSQEFTGSPLISLSRYTMYPDSDSLSKSEEEFEGRLSMELPDSARETDESGLFVCMTINDVANHCLELEPARLRYDALDIWELKTNPLKYWRCFDCKKRFPDQKSHMLHLESYHDLGISWDADWFVPSQVQQGGGSGVNEGVKERTCRLDDSITVDRTYRTFILEMEKFRSSYQHEDGGKAQDVNQFKLIVWRINREICFLRDMIDDKCRQSSPSEIVEQDAEVEQSFARLKKLKQELSDLCISDSKNEILVHISSFLKKRNLMDSGSWAFQRLNDLLGSIKSRQHPVSFSIKLESPGKVTINIQEREAMIRFDYVGIRLKFAGHLLGEESKNIKGILLFSATSKSYGDICLEEHIILDEEYEMTRELVIFKDLVASHVSYALQGKLIQFEAEVRERSQCQRTRCLYGFKWKANDAL